MRDPGIGLLRQKDGFVYILAQQHPLYIAADSVTMIGRSWRVEKLVFRWFALAESDDNEHIPLVDLALVALTATAWVQQPQIAGSSMLAGSTYVAMSSSYTSKRFG